MPPVNLDNAQFNLFLQFAMRQTNDKAIARVGATIAGDGPLAGRTITAAIRDRVAPIGPRAGDDKRANNATRELFREAVFAMFGGRANLPPKVAAAMKFGDYGTDARPLGKPLTARRILKVGRAIMEAMEPAVARVSLQTAGRLVDNAVSWMNALAPKSSGMRSFEALRLDAESRDKAARLVARHGAGLTAAGVGILAGYAAVAVVGGKRGLYSDREVETIVRRIAKTFKNVRNFRPGDPRLAAFDAKMTRYWQSMLDEQLGPKTAGHFDADGLFDSFLGDGGRDAYRIDDQVFPRGAEKRDRLAQAFKDRIPNLLHRKALSSFMCQLSWTAMLGISARDVLPETPGFRNLKMTSTKGHGLFLTTDMHDEFFQNRILLSESDEKEVALQVSADGSKATVRLRSPGNLVFRIHDAEYLSGNPAGTYEQEMEFDFDLSNPNGVRLTAVRHGQTIAAPVPPPPPQAAPGGGGVPRIDA